MSDDEGHEEDQQQSEAIRKMEERKRKQAQDADEFKEYEEQRKIEREKMDAEISELKSKREQRKAERAETERRMAEQRQVEEQRRRSEEEERQKKKRDEESAKREARDKKNKEHEERSKLMGKPNFVISKSDRPPGSTEEEEQPVEKTKSKEQLEAERKAILEQRIKPLDLSGLDKTGLTEKAKELYSLIEKICGDKYDLEHRYKEQNIEMQDLSERARQMNKGGKGKANKQEQEADPMAEKITGIPPKVTMYSQYEQVKDRRTFDDRQTLYKGPLYSDGWERIEPSNKIVMTEMGAKNTGEAYEAPTPGSNTAPPAPVASKPAPPPPAPEPEPEPEAQFEESGDAEVAVEE